MNRSRWPEALFALAATVTAALPLTSLFTPATFLRPVVVVLVAVVLAGVGLRSVLRSSVLVLLGQLVAGFLTASALLGQGHLWYWLPTPDMIGAWNNVLTEGIATVQSFAAPAPSTRGIILGLTLVVGALGLLVDFVAVTRRSPAVAGLVLLTAYLVSAANAGEGLNPLYFALAAMAWLVLVARQGTSTLRRWGPPAPLATPAEHESDDLGALRAASTGRRLGVLALGLAVVLPVVLPHLPAHYLVAGLGRSADGTGNGGSVGLTSTVDITRSLNDRSESEVLSYRSNAVIDTLRVGVLSTYDDGQWTSAAPRDESDDLPDNPPGLASAVTRSIARVSVFDNTISPPQLAMPYPAVAADLGRARWRVGDDGNIRPTRRASSYTVDYLRLAPTEEQLSGSVAFDDVSPVESADLVVDPAARPAVEALNRRLIPQGASEVEAARAIQDYLRGPDFTYSLQLAKDPRAGDRRVDPLTAFLDTKQGYCVQFASAMVMMARANGTPARMAIGFLPGTLNQDGTRTVRALDAHAWPELYFRGIGWLRFEPTPAGRTGAAPAYTAAPIDDPTGPTTSGGPSASDTSAPSATRDIDQQREDLGANATNAPLRQRVWTTVTNLTPGQWLLVLLVLGLLGSLAVPGAAAVRRRQAWAEAADEAMRVEARWQSLLHRIDDLGISPPVGSTPRQAGRFVAVSALLTAEDSQALGRVVDTLERARYAAPGAPLADVTADAHRVRGAVARTRRWTARVRAFLLPSEGLAELDAARRHAVAVPRAAWHRLRALAARGRPR